MGQRRLTKEGSRAHHWVGISFSSMLTAYVMGFLNHMEPTLADGVHRWADECDDVVIGIVDLKVKRYSKLLQCFQ